MSAPTRVHVYDLRHGLAVATLVDGLEAKLVAILHDAIEDGACSESDLEQAGLPASVVAAVVALTRRAEPYPEPYRTYIELLRESGNALAISVKLADLQTNLDRMDVEHHSLTSRYRDGLRVLGGDE